MSKPKTVLIAGHEIPIGTPYCRKCGLPARDTGFPVQCNCPPAPRTDSELAKDVRDAVNILNAALRRAHDAGLRIDVTDASHHTVARLDPLKIYHVEVYRTI